MAYNGVLRGQHKYITFECSLRGFGSAEVADWGHFAEKLESSKHLQKILMSLKYQQFPADSQIEWKGSEQQILSFTE